MVAARTAARGLTADELTSIRQALAAGRKPRVVFTEAAGQIAGQSGQVVSLGDPAQSGEWVVVRFGRDELPFSPADLRMAPRGAAKRVEPAPAAPADPAPPAPAGPEFVLDKVPAPRAQQAPAQPEPPPAPAAAQPAAGGPAAGGPAARKAARAGKPKTPAGLTVTLAYADGEWTVAATQGAKALARPYVVRPAEAMKMVALVDVPGVREAVEQIMAAERAEAQAQADRLRAELAEIEARLAELRDAH